MIAPGARRRYGRLTAYAWALKMGHALRRMGLVDHEDPLRGVLRLGARCTRILAVCGLAGFAAGPWASSPEDLFSADLKTFIIVGLLLLGPAWLLGSSIVSLRRLRALQERPLSTVGAARLWDLSANRDAVGLVPWGLFVGTGLPTSPTGDELWVTLYSLGLCGSLFVHLVIVPGLLFRHERQGAICPGECDGVAGVDEPVRRALRGVARRRLAGAALGLAAFVLPLADAGALSLSPPGTRPSWMQVGPATGLDLLRSDEARESRTARLLLTGVLVFAVLGVRGEIRARWPADRALSRTRTFGAWVVPLLACTPALVLWGGALAAISLVSPPLPGAWVAFVGLVWSLLVCIAFAPLLLMRALRERSELERKAALGERHAPPGA